MSEAVAQIVAQINMLTQQERVELDAFLLSLEPEDPNVQEAWDKELIRRGEEIRKGEAVGIPAEQVFEEWRRRTRP